MSWQDEVVTPKRDRAAYMRRYNRAKKLKAAGCAVGKKKRVVTDQGFRAAGLEQPYASRKVPDWVMADRDRRAGIELNANQIVLGDPLPGMSALERKKS